MWLIFPTGSASSHRFTCSPARNGVVTWQCDYTHLLLIPEVKPGRWDSIGQTYSRKCPSKTPAVWPVASAQQKIVQSYTFTLWSCWLLLHKVTNNKTVNFSDCTGIIKFERQGWVTVTRNFVNLCLRNFVMRCPTVNQRLCTCKFHTFESITAN